MLVPIPVSTIHEATVISYTHVTLLNYYGKVYSHSKAMESLHTVTRDAGKWVQRVVSQLHCEETKQRFNVKRLRCA